MVVDEQGLVAFAFALAEDDGRAIGCHDLRGEPAFFQHFLHHCGTFLQSQILRADAGLGNVALEFVEAFIEILVDVCVHLVKFAHDGLLGRFGVGHAYPMDIKHTYGMTHL
jgi:hypothetical protein